MKKYLVADLFCGAGGSSTGAERAVKDLGAVMILVCINHWPVAIETHKMNHPTARHYVEDVSVADPNKIVPEGYLDLLMASPECRFYSRARGGKPVHDQARMNPWAIHRWLTNLEVKCLLVENVPEFVDWGPTLDTGLPNPRYKGIYFQSWIKAIWEMGYKAEWRFLNAADFGDATTRTRFFLIARKDKRPIIWPEPSHSPTGERNMIGQLPRWRAAREIIEWDNLGRSLLDDPKYQRRPLSENTRRRIARGLQKFGGALAPLYIRLLGLNSEGTGQGGAQPFVMGKQGHSPSIRGIDKPIPTATADGRSCLVEPTAEPFVLGQQSKGAPRSTGKPIPTVSSDGAISVISPLIVKYYGTGVCHSTEEPVPTATTKDRIGLASPMIVPFRGERDGQEPRVHSVDDPVPTIVTKQNLGVVEPVTIRLIEPILKRAKEGDIDPQRLVLIDGEPFLLDIRFRMLSNLELARAMGFNDQESTYEFVGNISEVTRQIGNAVPVNMAKALVKSIFQGKTKKVSALQSNRK